MNGSEIAIIGMSGRFPGAADIRAFWHNLKAGKDSITFLTDEELESLAKSAYTDPKFVRSKGGVLADTDCFDAAFFGYNPKEVEIMDPQFRVFHELVWEALEDGGYAHDGHDYSIGLYAGATGNFPWQKKLFDSKQYENRKGLASIQLVERDFLTTLISYNLNLKGPSFLVQTACSTSLVAVHLACQAILNGECAMALAGGISFANGLDKGYHYQEGSIFSPDGKCHAFDAQAKGTIHGSGAGVVLLKLLEDALADGDNVHAVILGTAINNDGKQKAGFTAPSILGQSEVIRQAHRVADISSDNIGYIEAHGTGTELGDPIEIEALKIAFATNRRQFCGIGSLKTNIGHLDAAAGIAGLIKTALALKNKMLPPSLNFVSPNPKIDFNGSPFYVVDKLQPWASDTPRTAGVSSFGIGGTNAHAVLQEAPERRSRHNNRKNHLVLFTAKTEHSRDQWLLRFAEFLTNNTEACMADVAYTLQRRRIFNNRGFIVCGTPGEAVRKIVSNEIKKNIVLNNKADQEIAFLFPGQGSQYVGMAHDLYRNEPLFRTELTRCFEIFRSITTLDMERYVYGEQQGSLAIHETQLTQPLLFMLEYALARVMIRLGCKPSIMIGHSIGEYVAACVAGVFSLEDGIRIVTERGKLIQNLPTGSMLSVAADESVIAGYLQGNVSLAAVNGLSSCVIAGPADEIQLLQQRLSSASISSVILNTSHAFHSSMMDAMLPAFKKFLAGVEFKNPAIPFVSNVTGKLIEPQDAMSPAYWLNHLRKTVRFSDGLDTLLSYENLLLIEIGPGNTLTNFVSRHNEKKEGHVLCNTIRHERQQHLDDAFFYEAIGKIWLAGAPLDLSALYKDEQRMTVSLPAYAFEKNKIGEDHAKINLSENISIKEHARREMSDWVYCETWERRPMMRLDEETNIPAGQNWLVFVKENELGANILKRVGSGTVKTVAMGDHFRRISENGFMINPALESDYIKLLQESAFGDGESLNIIHGWSAGKEPADSGLSVERCSREMDFGFYSVVNVVKTFAKSFPSINLTVLTSHAFAVVGNDLLFPERSMQAALAKILPLEYRSLMCRVVDVTTEHLDGDYSTRCAEDILELMFRTKVERIIAFRGTSQWLPVIKPVSLEHYPINERIFEDHKVYVIVGLGGMGSFIAKYIAEHFQSDVIILHRSDFPAREQWAAMLATDSIDEQLRTKLSIFLEIENNGLGKLHFMKADVSDFERMQEVVESIEKLYGKISGVIHAAGVIDAGGILQRRSKDSIEGSLKSKVHGNVVLHSLFQKRKLDFLILFSSIGNELFEDKFGQIGYNAANEFVDAFASFAGESCARKVMTINWCDWQQVGMSIKAMNALFGEKDINREFVDSAVTPAEGVAVFMQVCRSRLSRVLLYPVSLLQRIEERERNLIRYDSYLHEKFNLLATASNAIKVVLTNGSTLDDTVINIWRDYLGYANIGVHDNIFELGATSLDAVQINNIYRTSLNIDVPVTTLFEYPTIHSFLQYVKKPDGHGGIRESETEQADRIDKGKRKLDRLKKISSLDIEV